MRKDERPCSIFCGRLLLNSGRRQSNNTSIAIIVNSPRSARSPSGPEKHHVGHHNGFVLQRQFQRRGGAREKTPAIASGLFHATAEVEQKDLARLDLCVPISNPTSTLADSRYCDTNSEARNRSLSIRSGKGNSNSSSPTHRKGFSFASLRGTIQPELSRRLYRLIKSINNLISAHETAGKERSTIAQELSEWGEQTQDEGVSDISDKIGVILSELGAQEDSYAHNLDDARGILKTIRNTEKSVQPSRDNKEKIADEIQKLKGKEPQSTRLVILEQELVRAEAENLVAEAQLTNVVRLYPTLFDLTRKKLREAYDAEFAAVIERAEKQIILAKHGKRLLTLLDDTPVTPGDVRREYEHGSAARQVLNDAEDDLRSWEKNRENAYKGHEAADFGTGRGEDSIKGSATETLADQRTKPDNEEFTSAPSTPSREE
ncbi:hypothetical protein RRF57_000435 [Xylaria bambusicola]|uniref:Sphingolipid long chain base-responsive protein LSP1 n=1 Tax=Xylaria bambusicola TaxID=326684 RepID=A0AAN7UEK0_9PEZI